jgi:hypothetical protein
LLASPIASIVQRSEWFAKDRGIWFLALPTCVAMQIILLLWCDVRHASRPHLGLLLIIQLEGILFVFDDSHVVRKRMSMHLVFHGSV